MRHPDPDQLALAALPAEEPDPGVTAHLRVCPLCAGHVASLRRTVDLARAGGDTVDDGAGPPERVWRAITDELGVPDPADVPVPDVPVPDVPVPAVPAPRIPPPVAPVPRAPAWRRVALAAAAAALVGLLVGLGIGSSAGPSVPAGPDGPVVALLVPVGDLDPGGRGEVVMARAGDEDRMRVTLQGVGDLGGGDYLEVWLLDAGGTRLVSLGGLTPGDGGYHGTFTVPAGLPFAEFSTVDVSVERWDGDPGHSKLSVLRGSLV